MFSSIVTVISLAQALERDRLCLETDYFTPFSMAGFLKVIHVAGKEIFDFIRAQAPPYPGAFFRTADGKKIVIERARVESQ